MKAGGSQWRMLWRKSPRRPANSTAPQSQNLGELDLELKVIPPTYAPPRPSPRWKTAHQPPEASASSYDLGHGLGRRVARIILTTSSLASRPPRQGRVGVERILLSSHLGSPCNLVERFSGAFFETGSHKALCKIGDC